ncbi:helix-turn-helix transcriptional regulator [Oscillibacter hominis]|uniref:Helix-turn-helix transcriptional regulator n=1 Tax=Oscillibacter hominis TaxID=2763056 RepID=A0A7G9B1V3_9FIRM|nr:helix-turn-helix transcriptional regulator [Oscillibacter hominis]QNL43534.1 helix-turn-helix transcriptional regulator [Oscillibacter hominis]
MTLADRLNQIIREQGISKSEFARRLGISRNYVYILTGNSRKGSPTGKNISPSLAKLIAIEFGYPEKWILTGERNS